MKRYLSLVVIAVVYIVLLTSFSALNNAKELENLDIAGKIVVVKNGDPSPYPPLPPPDTGLLNLKQNNGDPCPYPPLPPSDTGIN